MTAMLQFATLAIATMLAAIAALAFDWLLLRAAFALMRPATARRPALHSDLARGTARAARAFASRQ